METPDLSCFSNQIWDSVYEPAEDSFLMLDALEQDFAFVQKTLKPGFCMEVGSGSGVVITALAKHLGPSALYLTTDLNYAANLSTRQLAQHNGVQVEAVNCDLIGPLLPRLRGKVDLMLFNPPYVPTVSSEITDGDLLAKSWAGGVKGREITDRWLKVLPEILSKKGVAYLLIIKENDEEEILEMMAKMGMKGESILARRTGPEHLKILKFTFDL